MIRQSLKLIGTAVVIGKPAPCVSAFAAAVDEAIEDHHPGHGLSAIQRAWLAVEAGK
jgi:hypothetical protein